MLVSGLPFRAGEAGCEEQDQHGSGVHGGGRLQPGDWQGTLGPYPVRRVAKPNQPFFSVSGSGCPNFSGSSSGCCWGKFFFFFLIFFPFLLLLRLRVQQKGGLAAETPQLRLGLLKSLILICHSFSFFTGVIF